MGQQIDAPSLSRALDAKMLLVHGIRATLPRMVTLYLFFSFGPLGLLRGWLNQEGGKSTAARGECTLPYLLVPEWKERTPHEFMSAKSFEDEKAFSCVSCCCY